MIGVLVQFPNPTPRSYEEAAAEWSTHGPRYETQPGFVQKSFLMSPDGATVGGFYLWETREDAERFYSDEWRRRVAGYAGAEPQLTFFLVPTVLQARQPATPS